MTKRWCEPKPKCRDKSPSWQGHGEISLTRWNIIRSSAVRRSRVLPFEISIRQGWNLFIEQDRKCVLSGVPIQFAPTHDEENKCTASLDRIDNGRGYVLDNVQWVHKVINIIRWTLSVGEFKMWCKRVTLNAQEIW